MLFGIDRLLAEPDLRAPLKGRRVALLAHPASVTADLVHSLDALAALDDIQLTRAFTGLQANFLRPSIAATGLDPEALPEHLTPAEARERFGGGSAAHERPARWADIWSAGHSVSGVDGVPTVAELVAFVKRGYDEAAGRRGRAVA